MASPSVTYTFTNGTTASGTEVSTNFSDVINGITDGSKDLSINALTCAGAATLNGNVNLGNASSDDLTITASLASSLAIKTNATYGIGSSTLGLTGIYFGNSTFTTRIVPGTLSASNTLTLPTATDTVAVLAQAQTLTNKTIALASNTVTAANNNGIVHAGSGGTVTNSSTFLLTSTQIQMADGAVGTPCLSWSGDTNTGIYRSTGDEISVTCGGADKLVVSTSGIKVNGNATGDSNLGTISSVTLGSYYTGTFTATFDGQGFNASQNVTCTYTKIGNKVTLDIAGKTATGDGTGRAYIATTAGIPSGLRPTNTLFIPAVKVYNNAAALAAVGQLYISAAGLIRVYRSLDETTAFTASVTIGWDKISVSYNTSA